MRWKSESEEPLSKAPSQATPAVKPKPKAAQPKERALIGPSIYINGNLSGEEDLHIEGRVEGKIELKQNNVVIGQSGRVKADIYGQKIIIEGEVQGNLYGEEQLVLRRSSTVRGNIIAPRVTLEDGANFKGSIDMTPKGVEESTKATDLSELEMIIGSGSKDKDYEETTPSDTRDSERIPQKSPTRAAGQKA